MAVMPQRYVGDRLGTRKKIKYQSKWDNRDGSNKYVVIRYLLAQNIVVMMDKIPNSTNMVF